MGPLFFQQNEATQRNSAGCQYIEVEGLVNWPRTKKQYQTFETNIPRKGNARPQSQFPHSCVCERFIYSQDLSAYSVWTDPDHVNFGTEAAQFPEKEYINEIFVAVRSRPSPPPPPLTPRWGPDQWRGEDLGSCPTALDDWVREAHVGTNQRWGPQVEKMSQREREIL